MRSNESDWWTLVTRLAAVLTIASAVGMLGAWLYEAGSAIVTSLLGAIALFGCSYIFLVRVRWIRLVGAERPVESDVWVFVYGSLLDPDSLGTTIGRKVALHHYRPAVLRNHEKIWGAPVARVNMVGPNWEPIENRHWSSLTVTQKDGSNCFGAVVPVSDEELEQLDEREGSYEPENVTESVRRIERATLSRWQRFRALLRDLLNPGWSDLPDKEKQVYTYVPKKQRDSAGTCVRQRYIDMAREGHRYLILPDDIPRHGFPAKLEAFDADARFASRWARLPANRLFQWNHTLHGHLRGRDSIRFETRGQRVIRTLPRPIVFSASLHRAIREGAEELLKLSANTLEYVLQDTELAAACGFEPAELSLAEVEGPAAARFPEIARLDFVVNRTEVKLLEVNTDSPAGMAHFDAIAECYRNHLDEVLGEFCELEFPKPDSLKEALATAVRASWERHCGGPASPPSVAIVDKDIEIQPARKEFEIIRKYLARTFHGDEESTRVCVCGPKHLDFDGKQLTYNHQPIDLVYKRVLWEDLIDLGADAEALLRAYKAGAVCIVNSLRSRLMGNKRFLTMMQPDSKHREAIWRQVSPEKCEPYLAKARELNDDSLAQQVINEQNDWVLKSYRGFGARQVTIGQTVDRNQWKDAVKSALRKGRHIVQRFVPHGRSLVPIVNVTDVNPCNLVFIVGAYLVNGECVGLEGKATFQPPVSMNPPHCGYRTVVLSPVGQRS